MQDWEGTKRWDGIILNSINWKIGGQAGFGIMETGGIFAKCMVRAGLHVFDYTEYPSLIRGGHNTVQVRAEEQPVESPVKPINILVALNEETAVFHKDELAEHAAIVYDPADAKLDDGRLERDDLVYVPIPLEAMVREAKAPEITRNIIALGASLALLEFDQAIMQDVIRDAFKDKAKELQDTDISLALQGYEKAQSLSITFTHRIVNRTAEDHMLLTGNDALFLGAVRAGCKFISAYPMTPATSIVQSFASIEEDYGIVVKEPEDEISAINMAIGANLAGVRGMTATSGGGFCLMTEGLGLAAMTETPVVIVNSMRGGPSTGLPTWTDQADLRFVLHASHGDFPRIVVAPGDIKESFYLAFEAFNLAEEYQLPVIILNDKHLASSHQALKPFPEDDLVIKRGKLLGFHDLDNSSGYKRFAFTDDGISPRSVPGMQNGLFVATSDEHDEYGLYCEEEHNRNRMMEKRFQKWEQAKKAIPPPPLIGPEDADITIVSWGSTKGAILDALKFLKDTKVNFLQLQYLDPFPAERVQHILEKAKKVLLIEGTYKGHLDGIIREHTGFKIEHRLLKYSGRPFYPEEVCDKVRSLL